MKHRSRLRVTASSGGESCNIGLILFGRSVVARTIVGECSQEQPVSLCQGSALPLPSLPPEDPQPVEVVYGLYVPPSVLPSPPHRRASEDRERGSEKKE